jgi:exonuclease SbcC
MIKRLHLRNFQSHFDTSLRLSRGVNIIIGPSDVGKTAIVRGLRWVRFNRPLGESYRRHGTEQTRVLVETDKGVVVRKRDGKNGYRVNGKWLEAMRGEVPEAVAKVLPLEEDHFQGQMDSPFMLSRSAGEAARQLSRAAGLDEIQGIFNWLSVKLRAVTEERTRAEEEREQTLAELRESEWADKAIPIAREGLAVQAKLEKVEGQGERLSRLVGELRELGKPQPVGERLEVLKRLEVLIVKLSGLVSIMEELEAAEAEEAELSERVSTLTEGLPDTCPTCGQTLGESK